MNNRRKLLVALGVSVVATPLSSFAQQQGKIWRVGFLWEGEQSDYVQYIDAVNAGMRELGYVEGKDYAIEHRSAQNDLARLPALAAELIALKVNVIVPAGTSSAVAASKATREIPILIAIIGDPIGSGLADTLRRPGANVTGLTNLASELFTKRLDLLRQILPDMRRVGFLYNPDNAANVLGLKQFELGCTKLGFQSIRARVRKADEIASTFNALHREKAQGIIVTNASTNIAWRASIIEHAAKHRLPAVYGQNLFADSGGLLSYAANYPDLYRRTAAYADKIFKGAKPGDLPIEQPTKFELIANLKTAKALGIKIPNTILLQATKVIE
jgi:putative ABC transport system substrate-binding protein